MFTGTQPHLMALYNRWMNERMYAACATLSDVQRRKDLGLFFKSVHGTLNHILWGDQAWLARFTGGAGTTVPAGTELYADYESLWEARRALDTEILAWAAALTPEALNEPMTWTSKVYGFTQTQPRWVLVTQMFNHQTHHRGQVHAALTHFHVDMGATDVPLTPELLE
ncbi:MAG: DinB family protein [Polyangiales bacterium]|nr:damage-inducible protein DinB [Myxococcales bacterium]MCB9656803.1 damage-inducible protein DinB [Sandaracinaceae bacterium]